VAETGLTISKIHNSTNEGRKPPEKRREGESKLVSCRRNLLNSRGGVILRTKPRRESRRGVPFREKLRRKVTACAKERDGWQAIKGRGRKKGLERNKKALGWLGHPPRPENKKRKRRVEEGNRRRQKGKEPWLPTDRGRKTESPGYK